LDKVGTVTQQQGIIIFSMAKEAKIINWGQNILYTTELYQQLVK